MTYRIPTTFVGMADTTNIPTTVVGRHIPTKFVGTVYFDKSCIMKPGCLVRMLDKENQQLRELDLSYLELGDRLNNLKDKP